MFDNIEKLCNEKMSGHTTLHIGGFARWFLLPKNIFELEQIFYEARESGVEPFILGAGSNLLVSDEGYAGAVVSTKYFDEIVLLENGNLQVGGGVNLFKLNSFCAKNGLSGLEWSYGIPASVGGACKMNAGAYGGEFCNLLKEILVFDGIKVRRKTHFEFFYRKGCLKKNEILLSATLSLKKDDPSLIQKRQFDFLKQRKEKQPYGKFTLGSTFKRSCGIVPAVLIDKFGFKGAWRGGVQVSPKHAGFIVNENQGSAKDFLSVVQAIENTMLHYGYKFEREFVILK